MVKSWTSAQQIVAISNGGAELYAFVKGMSLADFDLNSMERAAIEISHRQGHERTRHLNVQNFWVHIDTITEDNTADILPKALASEIRFKHLLVLEFELANIRAPELV